jgi:hypothetical protein
MPLNPAFGLDPNAALAGSVDVFSAQQHQAADLDQQQASSSAMAQGMAFDLASTSTHVEGLDTTLDLVGQGFYTGNEYYQHWSHQDGHSNGQRSPWDATTVWSDGSSSIPDPMMPDEATLDSAWTQSMLDPNMCMDTYGEHNMSYYSPGVQQPHYGWSGKRRHGKSTSLSY